MCKTAGTTCVGTSDGGGICKPSAGRVACESKADCPESKPWCFFDAATHTGECIPRGPWSRTEGVLECDDHADCPEAQCCGGGLLTFCSPTECYPGLAYAAIICRTAKDCGTNEPYVPVCGVDERLPNGLGTCGWADPPAPP